MPRTLQLSLALVVVVVTAGACTAHRPDRENFYVGERVNQGDFPDVPAVVLVDRTEITFTYAPKLKKPYAQALHTIRTQVFTEAGLEYAKYRLPYDDRSKILWIRARIARPDGSEVKLDDNISVNLPRYQDGSPPARLYNDDGFKVAKVRGAKPGDVIELQYLRVYRDPRWIEPVRVGGPLPVKRGEVIVDYPRAFDVDYRVTRLGNVERSKPQKLPVRVYGPEGKGAGAPGVRLSFVFESEPAIYPEELRPREDALATQVHVQLRGYTLRSQRIAGFSTWNDVASWYRGLTKGTDRADGFLEKTLEQVGGKRGTKAQKIARAQRFLQDRVADVPTFLNLAALPSHGPERVLRAGTADSKDQASLGLATLRLMGLDAFPVLVSRLGSFAVVPDLPSPAPFNHVILAVPAGGSYKFIDPATPALPTGRLPGALQGQRALLVKPDGAELIDLPVDDPSRNSRRYEYKLRLDEAGVASGALKIELRGLDAGKVRAILRSDLSKSEKTAKIQGLLARDPELGLQWREVIAGGQGSQRSE